MNPEGSIASGSTQFLVDPFWTLKQTAVPPDPRVGAWRKGGEPTVTYLQTWLSSLLDREEGQGLAEYALILALIAIVAILALIFLGSQIQTILSYIGSAI